MRAKVATLLAIACACAGAPARPQPAASSAVDAWRAAHQHDDPRAAYRLLAADVQHAMPYATFLAQWQVTLTERDRQLEALDVALASAPELPSLAQLTLADGRQALMARETTGWRLTTPLLPAVHAATPADALRLLSRAIESGRVDALLRVLATRRKEDLSRLLDSFRSGLASRTGSDPEISGDRAFVRWSDGPLHWKITFIREDGEWRIDEVHGP